MIDTRLDVADLVYRVASVARLRSVVLLGRTTTRVPHDEVCTLGLYAETKTRETE